MKKETAVKLLKMLKVNYPASFRNMSKEDMNIMVQLWMQSFSEDEETLVEAAVSDFIMNTEEQFAPNVGQIRGRIRRASNALKMSADEAWDMVRKATRKGGTMDEWNKLPRSVQLALGSQRYLDELAMTDHEQMPFRRSNFVSRYKEVQEREETLELTSPVIIQALLEKRSELQSGASNKLIEG